MNVKWLQAQAGLMSGLNSQQRRELYAMVSDDTLAGMLVVMRSAERTKLLQELEQLDRPSLTGCCATSGLLCFLITDMGLLLMHKQTASIAKSD